MMWYKCAWVLIIQSSSSCFINNPELKFISVCYKLCQTPMIGKEILEPLLLLFSLYLSRGLICNGWSILLSSIKHILLPRLMFLWYPTPHLPLFLSTWCVLATPEDMEGELESKPIWHHDAVLLWTTYWFFWWPIGLGLLPKQSLHTWLYCKCSL